MSKVRRILFATDFSAAATRVYQYAIDFAADLDASIVVLHAHQEPANALPDGAVDLPQEIESDIRERVAAELKQFAESIDTKSVNVTTQLVEGVPYVEITNTASELGVDLIIVGTHGRTGLAHILLGSVAERVVRTSDVPVLTIRSSD
ncbi:MAG TPA: universal stress protein [Gammaproteobacteria bacterium]|jgi:nucleotide-binding universal stress UspA family protein|nr:universal stress protein [Gammaproteobacteria bacterium]